MIEEKLKTKLILQIKSNDKLQISSLQNFIILIPEKLQKKMSSSQNKRATLLVRAEKSFKQAKEDQKHQQRENRQKSPQKVIHTKKSQDKKSYMKTKTLSDEIERLLESAKQTKEKIFKGLQFVKLIDNFNQQQRCLEHNNVITLYCMNDKRLLCVYCIYGQNKHRSHKLLPPLQHLQYIAQDVYHLQNSFTQFIFSLQDVINQSRESTEVFKKLMKKYTTQLEAEYMKRKLQLQQLYQKQKLYINQTCEEMIEKTQHIFTEFQEIKFNIWQCQARYHLDKRVKIPNMPMPNDRINEQLSKTNSKIFNKKDLITTNKSNGKSPNKTKSSVKNEKQSSENKNLPQIIKHQISIDSQKDFRQIMSKHVILSHIVEQMKHIEPLKVDEKEAQKKLFQKSQFKLINNSSQQRGNSVIKSRINPNVSPKK